MARRFMGLGIALAPLKVWRLRAVAMTFGGVFAAAALITASPGLSSTLDQWATDLERGTYRALHRWGLPLPGTPDLRQLDARLKAGGFAAGDAVLVRVFKRESDLEVWLKRGNSFRLFATYPICKWAGELGSKRAQGDQQVPEGFYTVGKSQLNPNSRWFRSFNVGYPNKLDRLHGRTGSAIMVHGGCGSVGCVAVTNEAVAEIWKLVTAALDTSQPRFQVQIYPFRMTEANLTRYADSEWLANWRDLQAGYALFESSRVPPVASICDKRYAFTAGRPGSDGSTELTTGCPAAFAAHN